MAIKKNKKNQQTAARDASAFSRSAYGSGETSTYQDHMRGGAMAEEAENEHSRNGFAGHSYSRQRKLKNKRSRKRKVVVAIVLTLVVLLVGGAGAAWAYVNYLDNNMNGLDEDAMNSLVVTDAPSDPFYMLLIGVDKSEAREDSGNWGNYRTDSIILTRVDPGEKKITMVSIARDTQYEIEGYGLQKINAAYTIGGPSGAIDAISDLAGVPISHYAEIDFDAFREVVDKLGGVEVDVKYEVNDSHVDDVIKPGKQTLNGSQALSLCRSRHSYDEVGDGDNLRTANQRMVLSAIMRKVLDSDPATMLSTVNTMTGYVTTDMSASYILGLAQAFYGMDVDKDVYTASMPKTSEYVDGVWWDICLEAEWKEMMARVDQGLPPTAEEQIDEGTGIVVSSSGATDSADKDDDTIRLNGVDIAVKNGSEISGAAAAAGEKLEAVGAQVDTGNADSSDYSKTLIIYEDAGDKAKAEKIQKALGIGTVQQNDGTYSYAADYLVVIGADWK